MDSAIERGEFAEASAMSDRLMQRKVLQYYLEQRPVIYLIYYLSYSLPPKLLQPLTVMSL